MRGIDPASRAREALGGLRESTSPCRAGPARKYQQHLARIVPKLADRSQTCQALVKQQPSFLSQPEWAIAIEAPLPYVQYDIRTKLLISHYKCAAQLTAVRKDMRSLDSSTGVHDPRSLVIYRQLLDLRKTCKAELRLASNADSTDSKLSSLSFSCNNLAMIFCKCATGHIMVDTTLLELYAISSTLSTSPTEVSGTCHRSLTDHTLTKSHIDLEIEGLFELARSSFHKAAKSSPLGWRGMLSTFRVICSQAREIRGYHPVWDSYHQILNREGYVEGRNQGDA